MKETELATRHVALIVRSTLALMFFATVLEFVGVATEADARVGGGRSFGRSSGFSSRRSAPPPRQADPAQNYGRPGGMSQSQPPNAPAGGGFMRGLAGGIAGGFLGSMLFSSLGHAFGGGMGGAAQGGGGIGLLEIMLFGGLAYFGLRWWKSRQQAATVSSYGVTGGAVIRPLERGAGWGTDRLFAPGTAAPASAPPACIDGDEASDCFFKVQGAWTRRDLSSVRNLLGPQVAETLDNDLQALRRDQRVNRLENIAVRNVDVGEPWQEDGADLVTVRFTANLLDYTVDERSGDVVDGSNTVPVKFEEDWTFRRAPGSRGWLLVGLAQI